MTTPAVNPSPDISFALCINQSVCLSVSSSYFGTKKKGFMGRKEEMRDQEIKKLAVIMVVIGG